MYKYKVIFLFLLTVLIMTAAQGQVILGNSQTKTISGIVANVDFVGNTITILITGQQQQQQQMSFYVPGNAIIKRDTHDIGLMDIKAGHPVTIQYDTPSPGKVIVDSIVDNPVDHE